MTRLPVLLTLAGLAAAPAAATAFCWRLRCRPVPVAVVPCPPPVYVVPCPVIPQCEVPLSEAPAAPPNPPRVDVETPARPTPATPEPAKPATPKPDAPKPPAAAAPAPKPADAPAPAGFATPTPAVPVLPSTTDPKPFDPKPITPAAPPPKPPEETPKPADGVKLPPLVPPLPGGDATLPPLSLPTAPAPRKSQSSPIYTASVVDVFTVDGDKARPGDRRTVGFFNHTGRDVALTVEGATVTLPPRHSVTASVAARFAWALDGEPAREGSVPAGAPGIEVVIRK